IYGSLRRWSAQHFRATLQAYFLPASLVGVGWYWGDGLLGPEVFRLFLLCLPGAVVAILLGRAINRRLRGRAFLKFIHAGLIVIGIALLLQVGRP
ncbi:MAG TPA: TSUP family transporter, partial [Gemmataceae bacterium]|nr:TSUP family transporter [Gemmataceae bacterium]